MCSVKISIFPEAAGSLGLSFQLTKPKGGLLETLGKVLAFLMKASFLLPSPLPSTLPNPFPLTPLSLLHSIPPFFFEPKTYTFGEAILHVGGNKHED